MAILVLVVRVAIGALLIVAGVLKALDGFAVTTATVAAYRLLPPALNALAGVLLPYFEIGLGAYLVAGLFVRGAAIVAAFQFGIFALAVASLIVRNIPANCGCFGAAQASPPSWGHVALDVALLGLCTLVALRPEGRFSVDALLNGSRLKAPPRTTDA